MGCYRPLGAFQNPVGGDVSFHERKGDRPLRLPCGRCIGCRLDYSLGWSIRCQHEAQLYDRNSFVTLTYDDDHLPSSGSLHYPHVQNFLKRFRKRLTKTCPGQRLRFFCAGEYGSKTFRAHYHLLFFGVDFPDRSPIGKRLFRSDVLEELWPYGNSSCGNVSPQSASYVSRYSLKKVYGQAANSAYINPFTGECIRPEFCTMSRRPGLGARWFEKFGKDVLPCDYVVVEGKKLRVPRFYSTRFESMNPAAFGDVVEERERQVLLRPAEDRMPARLRDAEQVAHARVKFFYERSL